MDIEKIIKDHCLLKRTPGNSSEIIVGVFECSPDKVEIELSIQEELNLKEIIDRSGDLPGIQGVTDPDKIRGAIITIEEHILKTYLKTKLEPIFVSGNGNLLQNNHFVAVKGKLYRHQKELFLDRKYSCLVKRDCGITIEELSFDQLYQKNFPCKYTKQFGKLKWATFGQRLVKEGEPVITEKRKPSPAEQFYDKRHVYALAQLQCADSDRSDEQLYFGNHRLQDSDFFYKAANGPVILKPEFKVINATWSFDSEDLATFLGLPSPNEQKVRDMVCDALDKAGYQETNLSVEKGEFMILSGNRFKIQLREGIYPHHIIGLKPGNRLMDITVIGESRRAGLTLQSAAELCKKLGLTDAILLDNGKDVQARIRKDIANTGSQNKGFKVVQAGATADPQQRSKMTSVFVYCLKNADDKPCDIGISWQQF